MTKHSFPAKLAIQLRFKLMNINTDLSAASQRQVTLKIINIHK